jgi:hypothetical protein
MRIGSVLKNSSQAVLAGVLISSLVVGLMAGSALAAKPSGGGGKHGGGGYRVRSLGSSFYDPDGCALPVVRPRTNRPQLMEHLGHRPSSRRDVALGPEAVRRDAVPPRSGRGGTDPAAWTGNVWAGTAMRTRFAEASASRTTTFRLLLPRSRGTSLS